MLVATMASCLGAFTIYVYKYSHIFDHPPTFIYNFCAMNVYKFSRFLTSHQLSIVKVNCERPLRLQVSCPVQIININRMTAIQRILLRTAGTFHQEVI